MAYKSGLLTTYVSPGMILAGSVGWSLVEQLRAETEVGWVGHGTNTSGHLILHTFPMFSWQRPWLVHVSFRVDQLLGPWG